MGLILEKVGDDQAMPAMKRKTGRPSRGPRDIFTVKLTLSDGESLRELADLQDLSYQDLLEAIVSEFLQGIDVAALNGQEPLPIAKAS